MAACLVDARIGAEQVGQCGLACSAEAVQADGVRKELPTAIQKMLFENCQLARPPYVVRGRRWRLKGSGWLFAELDT